jgi:hypothetical protein
VDFRLGRSFFITRAWLKNRPLHFRAPCSNKHSRIDAALWKENGCTTKLIASNEVFHLMLTKGTKVSFQMQRQTRVRLATNPEK